MSELSPEALALLDAVRLESLPTDVDRERVRRALSAAVGPLPLPEAQPALEGVPPSGNAIPLALAALGIAAALGLAVGAVVFWPAPPIRRSPISLQVSAPAVAAPPPMLAPPAAVDPEPGPAPSSAAPPARTTAKVRPAPPRPPSQVFAPMDLSGHDDPPAAPPPSSLAEELELLRQAQLARATDAARALQILAQHERWFPRGALAEERTAAKIDALCALHRTDEAREEAERFLAETPRSPYASKVRDSCAGGR